ncbi:glycosyltransferase family 39 protein [Sporolactobacillus shoreicorticis]|uniref:ArnT family glycosyltransferase n=1 Tax=Sporolactobacillus shoreicorticis TaxID=1923877 RepID=A0ABW5RXV2_9BACL|nr:glycosyltransferase family 39 protein [Sporolactobacillus shoreicorticis]MCO7124755.1 glycosyltransferase family 39 protein [Sporolactobacillus shoreicorticis]
MNLFKKKRIDFYLIGVILFSGFMNFFLLNKASTNEYYTVAVKSMMKSFHNFFYASFDPAGFITVDKPPVALWLQTISAKLFGFSNFSVLLPGAAAAIVSTVIVYQMVKRRAGKLPAFISGMIMSVTPIFIAVTRTNNTDSTLILCLVIAAWAVLKAASTAQFRWLLLSVAMIGIGFNVKMFEAFMIVPAVYLFYWIAMKINWKKKMLHLLAATVVLAGVSLSWAVVVDLTPASKRPYVGGSQTNSVLELAFGYNGVSRLTGQQGGGGQKAGTMPSMGKNNKAQSGTTVSENAPAVKSSSGGNSSENQMGGTPNGRTGGGGRQGNMFGTGNAGPFRLFSKSLSGQASWLLPFVLFSVIAIAADWLRRRKLDEKHSFTIFWLAWLVPAMVFFSIAGFFHQYYLSLMAPPIAALVGIGFAYLWRDFSDPKSSWRGYLLPIAFGATLLFEAVIFYQNSIGTIWTMLLIAAAIMTIGFGVVWRTAEWKVQSAIAGSSLLLMLLAPLYWTLPSTFNQTNSATPIAGPSATQSGMGAMGGGGQQRSGNQSSDENGFPGDGPGGSPGEAPSVNNESGAAGNSQGSNGTQEQFEQMPNRTFNKSMRQGGMGEQVNTKLLNYLRKHYNGEKFILAVPSAQSAYSIMMKTNYAVMAMGGFGGSDPALTVSKLEKMVKAGEIKYFLISGNRGGAQNSSITNWIKKNCTKVKSSDWSSSDSSSQSGSEGQSTLYVYNK